MILFPFLPVFFRIFRSHLEKIPVCSGPFPEFSPPCASFPGAQPGPSSPASLRRRRGLPFAGALSAPRRAFLPAAKNSQAVSAALWRRDTACARGGRAAPPGGAGRPPCTGLLFGEEQRFRPDRKASRMLPYFSSVLTCDTLPGSIFVDFFEAILWYLLFFSFLFCKIP